MFENDSDVYVLLQSESTYLYKAKIGAVKKDYPELSKEKMREIQVSCRQELDQIKKYYFDLFCDSHFDSEVLIEQMTRDFEAWFDSVYGNENLN